MKFISGVAIVCTSCAIQAGLPSKPEAATLFASFENRPVASLTDRLGSPRDERHVGGEDWFIWDFINGAFSCQLSARVEGSTVRAVRTIGHADGCLMLADRLRKP